MFCVSSNCTFVLSTSCYFVFSFVYFYIVFVIVRFDFEFNCFDLLSVRCCFMFLSLKGKALKPGTSWTLDMEF